jgi:hypothetical protein
MNKYIYIYIYICMCMKLNMLIVLENIIYEQEHGAFISVSVSVDMKMSR